MHINENFPFVCIFHFLKMHINVIFPFVCTFYSLKMHINAFFPFVCISLSHHRGYERNFCAGARLVFCHRRIFFDSDKTLCPIFMS